MFDLMEDIEENIEAQKYTFIEKEEMDPRELLSLEKEMLGVYISGHPLDKFRGSIEKHANISTLDMIKIDEEVQEFGESKEYKDGQNVKFVGIISKVNKKFTRKNTTMAFVNIEDFYGTAEFVIFDSVYTKSSHIIVEDNIIVIFAVIKLNQRTGTVGKQQLSFLRFISCTKIRQKLNVNNCIGIGTNTFNFIGNDFCLESTAYNAILDGNIHICFGKTKGKFYS